MQTKDNPHVFEEKTYFLPLDDYLEMCRGSLIKHLNYINKRKDSIDSFRELTNLGINLSLMKKLIKMSDAKVFIKFISKQKGFDVGMALNQLCQDILSSKKIEDKE